MMQRANAVEYAQRFQAYLRSRRTIQLAEPRGTGEYLFYAMELGEVDISDFDSVLWNSAVVWMAKAIIEQDFREYYTLSVGSTDHGFMCLASSRSLLTGAGQCIIRGGVCV